MYKNKEEVQERISQISSERDEKLRNADKLKASAFADMGRIDELTILYNMFAEEEEDEG